jgi:3-phenylpropionate/cinnamic acid dioxygenase small subunit
VTGTMTVGPESTADRDSAGGRETDVLLREIEAFVYHEGGLQDRHEYDAWEALWTEDGVYWIPANGDDIDPEREMSIIYDNRSRIALRIKQLHTGRRLAQTPKSNLVRVISNIEILAVSAGDIKVRANAIIFESAPRRDTLWGARYEYILRRSGGSLKMARKKVVLVNNAKPLPNLAFLI